MDDAVCDKCKKQKTFSERFDEKFPIEHYECEDGWYSCPKSDEGCFNDGVSDECNCGAEKRSMKLKQFFFSELKDIIKDIENCDIYGWKEGSQNLAKTKILEIIKSRLK